MSSRDLAISVNGLDKSYTIVHNTVRHSTLAEELLHRLRHPFQRLEREVFWALRDVSFEVRRGETIALIGRNGAGKSTLLKVLSRITEPTRGVADLFGRVGCLLEVGTGFHPELTGRENIFLNGTILGMSRGEIRKRFDEIVEFSGIEKFLDTPVKRYSSGMYVRLAFAVAAHLNPEILIVDEVLAVGDAEFQKKCLGKMSEVAREGRTVLFVSHNMNAVLNLCTRALLIESGRVTLDGEVTRVVDRYLEMGQSAGAFDPKRGRRAGDGRAFITHFEVRPNVPQTGAPLELHFEIERPHEDASPLTAELGVGILTEHGAKIAEMYSRNMGVSFDLRPGKGRYTAVIDRLPFVPGRYRLNLWLGSGFHCIDFLEDCLLLTVSPGCLNGDTFAENFGFPVTLPMAWHAAEKVPTVEKQV